MKENENKRDKTAILQLYDKVLPVLAERINQNLAPVIPLFQDYALERQAVTWGKSQDGTASNISIENGNVQQIGLRMRLEGFQRAGAEAFDVAKDLLFRLEYDYYQVGPAKDAVWLEKSYDQPWTKEEFETIASRWCEDLVEEITQQLNRFSN